MVIAAISSALDQHVIIPEIIVVDDGSIDGSAAIIKNKFPSVTIIPLPGLGPGMARNAGVEAAGGDILMFLDSDDVWHAHHVENLVKVINSGYQIAYGVTTTRDEINGREFLIPENSAGSSGDCFDALCNWCFLVPSATAMTRKAFDAAGGFGPETLGEDWCFFLRLAARYPFGFFAETPITLRRLHGGSLCSTLNAKNLLTLTENLRNTLKKEKRTRPQGFARIDTMKKLIMTRGTEFKTIQDLYLALHREEVSCLY